MEKYGELSFWLNYNDYTVFQLALALVGSVLWVGAYILLIKDARKHKFAEMPFFIACGNFAWEVLYAFVFDDYINLGYLYVLGYKSWFFLDIYIFWLIAKYGRKQTDNAFIQKHFVKIMFALFAMFTTLFYFWIQNGWDNTPFNAPHTDGNLSTVILGTNSAFILNLGISILYVVLYTSRYQKGYYFSKLNAIYRGVGTGLFTILFWQVDPENDLLHTLGVFIFIIDSLYIFLLYKLKPASQKTAQDNK